MKRSLALLLPAAALAGALLPASAPALSVAPSAAPTLLRLDGIGPLRLGMTQSAALRTGWLANRGTGCELGGRPFPVTYQLSGSRAPDGVVGSAEFQRGRLRNLSFTRGVRTAAGVVVGRTTARGTVNRYRASGFRASAQFFDTFQGTFVAVQRGSGSQLLGAFARGRTSARRPIAVLGIPYVPTCE